MYIPLHNFEGESFGYQARSLSKFCVIKCLNHGIPKYDFKFPSLAYYLCDTADSESLLVVEDAFSAIRASVFRDTAAILSTHLNAEKVVEVSRNYDSITLALDKDATSKAFKLQKELGCLLPIKVLTLERDLKDLDEAALKAKIL